MEVVEGAMVATVAATVETEMQGVGTGAEAVWVVAGEASVVKAMMVAAVATLAAVDT